MAAGRKPVEVVPAPDVQRRGEPRLQRPPGVARCHRRRCADAWGVGEGICGGGEATGGYGRGEGGGLGMSMLNQVPTAGDCADW